MRSSSIISRCSTPSHSPPSGLQTVDVSGRTWRGHGRQLTGVRPQRHGGGRGGGAPRRSIWRQTQATTPSHTTSHRQVDSHRQWARACPRGPRDNCCQIDRLHVHGLTRPGDVQFSRPRNTNHVIPPYSTVTLFERSVVYKNTTKYALIFTLPLPDEFVVAVSFGTKSVFSFGET